MQVVHINTTMPDAAATEAKNTPPADGANAGLLTGQVPTADAAAQAAKAAADAAAAAAAKDPAKVAADAAKAKADADAAAAEAKANAVPEAGAYEFTKPKEGALNADDEADALADAKALKLTARQAQALYDHRAAQTKADLQAYKDQNARLQKQWVEELRNDKEFGPKFEANVVNANKAIARFSPDGSMAKLLSVEGMQNNPTIAKFLASIGSAMAEGTFHAGAPPALPPPGSRSFEQVANGLFPTLAANKKA